MSNPTDVGTWTIGDCVEQLETCAYTCEAGTLKNNVAYRRILTIHDEQAARIAALEQQLAEARERERFIIESLELNHCFDPHYSLHPVTREVRQDIAAKILIAAALAAGGEVDD